MSELIKYEPPPLASPCYPVYELSLSGGGCLFLSVATAVAVHDITKIFITPASKSRQTDDKHARGWVSFSDLKFITRRTHTPLCAFLMLFMTEISCRHRLFLTDWLSCGVFCRPSWQRYSKLPVKHCINQSNKNILPPRCFTTLSAFAAEILRSFYTTSTDWVEFNSVLF